MHNRGIKVAALIVIFALGCVTTGRYTEAAQTTAMLRECLLSETMYKDEYIDAMNNSFKADAKKFKDGYNGKAVCVTGRIMPGSLDRDRGELILYGSAGSLTVDISDKKLQNYFGGLSDYEQVKAYGKIKVSGFSNDSYKLVAAHLSVNPDPFIRNGQYSFYGDDGIYGDTVNDISDDGHVSITIPHGWNDTYCMGRLTNNGIKGYRFYLNAIEPRDLEYPEMFNVFYFSYMEYLEPKPKNPSRSARGYIEELIVRNILKDLDADFKLRSSSIKAGDREFDYISTSYALASGKTYTMEFLFLPDEKGLTCILYLYYPKETAVNHLHEVAYLVETIEN